MPCTRRSFLRSAASALWIPALWSVNTTSRAAEQSASTAIKLGLASYTTRNFDLEGTLEIARKVGLESIAFKSFHMPLDATDEEIRQIAERTRKAGFDLYGGGVIYMKTEAEVLNAFRYARAASLQTIIGVPDPSLLALVNEQVKSSGIAVAIHNHGPGDDIYPTPEVAYNRVRELDPRIGLCMDIGHTARSGVNPSEAAEQFADRLLDVHLKDVTAWEGSGQTVEMGRGVIDIPEFFRTLKKIRYSGFASFEYEKDADAPTPGLAESVGYARGVLAALS